MRFKEYRKKLGLTQIEMGELLEINYTTVGHYEQGRAVPSLEVLYRMVKRLPISADRLLAMFAEEDKPSQRRFAKSRQ